MIHIMSYTGMSLQSELSLWSLLGLLTCIFDATLFKVNSNLKQVWQMRMPEELSLPLQQFLRSMISGVMLVQCFTVYVYLASYIVMMYPVFLEERPNLLLPWLLLAAVKKLLCELTSLALGLGICVLLGPARTTCIKFVVTKIVAILPSFYMWILVYSYYNNLKISGPYMAFTSIRQKNSVEDNGLELAVRRRRTKSLFDEEQLRNKLIAHLSGDKQSTSSAANIQRIDRKCSNIKYEPTVDNELEPKPTFFRSQSSQGFFENWLDDIIMPRDTDRVTEQFCIMLLRIAASRKHELPTVELQNDIFKNDDQTSIAFWEPGLKYEELENASSVMVEQNYPEQNNSEHKVELSNNPSETEFDYVSSSSSSVIDENNFNNPVHKTGLNTSNTPSEIHGIDENPIHNTGTVESSNSKKINDIVPPKNE